MRRFGTGLAVLACLVAFGCGGDGDDGGSSGNGGGADSAEEAAVRDALVGFAKAIEANDPAAACSYLTKRAQDKAAETFPGATSCVSAHRLALNAVSPDQREGVSDQLEKAKFTIEVEGDTAELRSLDNRDADPLKMKKVGGEWKIDQSTVLFTPKRD